jgi:hypothetical protein
MYYVCFFRGGLLDGHRGETGCTNKGFVSEDYIETRCCIFDLETNTGEVVGRMSGDTVLIQDAMGEKVLQCCYITLNANSMHLFAHDPGV